MTAHWAHCQEPFPLIQREPLIPFCPLYSPISFLLPPPLSPLSPNGYSCLSTSQHLELTNAPGAHLRGIFAKFDVGKATSNLDLWSSKTYFYSGSFELGIPVKEWRSIEYHATLLLWWVSAAVAGSLCSAWVISGTESLCSCGCVALDTLPACTAAASLFLPVSSW